MVEFGLWPVLAFEEKRPKLRIQTGQRIKKLEIPLERSRSVDVIYALKHRNRPALGQDMAV